MNTIFTSQQYSITESARLPLFISNLIDENDLVVTFYKLMKELNIKKYLGDISYNGGPRGYSLVRMLYTVLFSFCDTGYCSLRELEKKCKTDIRYIWLMNYEYPSYKTFGNFINNYLGDKLEELFKDFNEIIFKKDNVDLTHLYIDGTKLEANANKYSWVWKKAAIKSRFKLFGKIKKLFISINDSNSNYNFNINEEYAIEYLETCINEYKTINDIDESKFVYGKGKRKTKIQRNYELLIEYTNKLKEYAYKINTCGNRNSYSKIDKDATFMRIKRDYMGNDQLLPAYNVQIGVADEYIAVVDVNSYRSDVDCFIPLMEKFKATYGFYPKYPVADAGYGSYSNYLFCELNNMKKFMKFPMYEKETKDKNYRNNEFRSINFKRDNEGFLVCPNNKRFHFQYRKHIKGNNYGRTSEVYECEDCSNCPLKDKCHKGNGNRKININDELTGFHNEVISNLESTHGALLRMNRSIQAEGTFGILKQDRWYKRIVRKGEIKVKLEIYLVSIGHNIYKYHKKKQRINEIDEIQ